MGIIIKKSGLFTTIQDLGRIGYQSYGFSVCGVMDKKSAIIANMLVDNDINEAVLEITINGPIIKFAESNIISITGSDFNAKINNVSAPLYQAILINKGDILSFGYGKNGSRAYVSFSGGLKIPKVMGSKSTDVRCKIGGFKGRVLKADDYISFENPTDYISNFLSKKIYIPKNNIQQEVTLRVILGPQDNYFTEDGINTFFSNSYTISNEFDRMGCKLDGPFIKHKNEADIISDGIALGSIQIPSHGKPIIMLSDRQTTGGYTKIGTIISIDIHKLVQRKVGDKVNFKSISIEEAQKLYNDEILYYEKLKEKLNKPSMEVLNPRKTSRKIENILTGGKHSEFK